jgi:Predicted nucleotide-binding protein containing TIR-like domain
VAKIGEAGYAPQEFLQSGIPQDRGWSWSLENFDRVIRKCVGAVVFGFPKWTVPGPPLHAAGNHYEGGVLLTLGLPVLLIIEQGVENRGVGWTGGGKVITFVPENADPSWVTSDDFTKPFEAWLRELDARKDVCLGYCSKSVDTARLIKRQLTDCGATVLDWADFPPGGTILDQIEKARAECSCGVFLFSEDDLLEGGAAPRDNVVFEAGYFMSSKGSERCLIVRHGEAKMPVDFGGVIYVHLAKTDDVASIKERLDDFLTKNV